MLRERLVTAVALIAALLAIVLLLPPLYTLLGVAAVILGGAWEWSAFGRRPERTRRAAYVAVCGAGMLLIYLWDAAGGTVQWIWWISLGWWVLALMWVVRYPDPLHAGQVGIAGLASLWPAWSAVVYLVNQPGDGGATLLTVLIIIWLADIGAYFCGRRYGRVKLAPRVSPGKTWEGVIGGLLAATAAGATLGATLLPVPLGAFVPLVIAAVLVSVVGDLTVSLFKRNAGLKDSGHLIPGHGGILDRIDSLVAAAPLFALGLTALGGPLP